ncbi:MAG: lytic transglycosylase domain-containing protein [Woeseia sp.]
MPHRIRLRGAWLMALWLSSTGVAGQGDVPPAYRATAAQHGIPVELLYAMALAESGKQVATGHLDAVHRPWPWTLNIAGRGTYFASREAAWLALDRSLAAGQTSVDIGLMQVNWRYHADALGSTWRALDPYHNLSVAAEILKRCYRERRDWWTSVGCYHAPSNDQRARRYRERVLAHWRAVTGAS